MKVVVIVGARPNFVKISPLFGELKKHREIKPVLIHTGQHYDYRLSQIFFRELEIPKPHYNLRVGSGSHAWQTAETMKRLEPIILKEKPDLIIVVGDINSTLAGALVAVKLHIRLAHIEAGPRTYDKNMPEEINRILVDHISDFLFCPTKVSMENLRKEGIKKGVYNTGDIMYDAFLKILEIALRKSKILEELKLETKKYCLFTLHRPSNVDNPKILKRILEVIMKSNEKVIFSVHPRTQRQISKLKILKSQNFIFIKPVGYPDMLILEKNAKKIITDSGGIQKEAYWLKVPCITLMDNTGWPETVDSGWNILVGANKDKILEAIKGFNPKKRQRNYFGNGKTAKKIVKILLARYRKLDIFKSKVR